MVLGLLYPLVYLVFVGLVESGESLLPNLLVMAVFVLLHNGVCVWVVWHVCSVLLKPCVRCVELVWSVGPSSVPIFT